jgi:hypothetical protein
MEVVAWVNNNWQTQWISGSNTADVGRFEVQVGLGTEQVKVVL